MTGPLDAHVRAGFAAAFGGKPTAMVRAPGRVNLIGEHTDYNDGFVLPCAIGVETRVAFRARDDGVLRVVARDFGDATDAFPLASPVMHHPDGGWRDYVRAMAETLLDRGHRLRGADLAIAGDIPRGAGLSSSASLEVAVADALLAVAGQGADRTTVALMAQAAENNFVGVRCGVMDQLASSASVAGAALLIDCRSLEMRPVPIPAGVAVAIIHSGVVRGLVDGHYNRRRAECEAAAAALGIARLRDADERMVAEAIAMSSDVRARARHVVTENARVLAGADALAAGDLVRVGQVMAESHASMRDDFCITVPAIDRLAAVAQDAIRQVDGGRGGARMTGGGFGGAVVALLRTEAVPAVTTAIREGYRTPAGEPPAIMIERAVAGASRVH